MKIRIQDNSIRYRLTASECEALASGAPLQVRTRVLSAGGPAGDLHYAIEPDPALGESEVVVESGSVRLRLGGPDCRALREPEAEGVYIRREWIDAAGDTHRFMIYVEKDRGKLPRNEPEAWMRDT